MLIFVDLVCRAIDVELLTDMTTAEIALAFRRFMARRRAPAFVLSDNAPQFTLFHTVLASTLRGLFVWKFLPECSPWQGGTYERMIGIVKQSLFRTFSHSTLSEISLRTALTEVVAVMDDRPLTYVSEDQADVPITPNDLLKSRFTRFYETEPSVPLTVTASHVVHMWKQVDQATAAFWSIWREVYLQELRRNCTSYSFPKKTTLVIPREGIVVLVTEPNMKRQNWRIGRILTLNTSADGQIRSADIRLGDKSKGLKVRPGPIVTRPLFHLFPLEVPDEYHPADVSSPTLQSQEIETEEIEIQLDDDF